MDNKELINLYLEQIKYLRQENISIQDKFLASVSIPLSVLGVVVYNIETSTNKNFSNFYLFLVFLYFLIPFNTLKYSIRMMGINGYIKYLEYKINNFMEENVFSWNTRLINSGYFGGFAFTTTLAQIPIYIVCFIFLFKKYLEIKNEGVYFKEYYFVFDIFLAILILSIIFMFVNAIFVQPIILGKLYLNKDKINIKEIVIYGKKWCIHNCNEDIDNRVNELTILFEKLDDNHKKDLLNYAHTLSQNQPKANLIRKGNKKPRKQK